MGSFSRLGSIKTCGMVWYAMLFLNVSISRKRLWDVLERIEAFGKRLNAFRAFWERMGAFGRLDKLVSITPYVCMVCKVCSIVTKTRPLMNLKRGLLPLYR